MSDLLKNFIPKKLISRILIISLFENKKDLILKDFLYLVLYCFFMSNEE